MAGSEPAQARSPLRHFDILLVVRLQATGAKPNSTNAAPSIHAKKLASSTTCMRTYCVRPPVSWRDLYLLANAYAT